MRIIYCFMFQGSATSGYEWHINAASRDASKAESLRICPELRTNDYEFDISVAATDARIERRAEQLFNAFPLA